MKPEKKVEIVHLSMTSSMSTFYSSAKKIKAYSHKHLTCV